MVIWNISKKQKYKKSKVTYPYEEAHGKEVHDVHVKVGVDVSLNVWDSVVVSMDDPDQNSGDQQAQSTDKEQNGMFSKVPVYSGYIVAMQDRHIEIHLKKKQVFMLFLFYFFSRVFYKNVWFHAQKVMWLFLKSTSFSQARISNACSERLSLAIMIVENH